MNKFDDIWFWPLELTKNMFGAAAEQIYTFLQGPAVLSTELFIPASSNGNNDLHIVTYVPDLYAKEYADALKIYRKLNIENTAQKTVFNYRYWLVDDKEIAAKLQIDTTKPG